jgi:hypothetical protein
MQPKKELSLNEYMERFSSEEKCLEYLIEKNGRMVIAARSVDP